MCIDFVASCPVYVCTYVCLFHASQYGGSVLRAAATSGNAALYDWLVTSFGLQALTQDGSVRHSPIPPHSQLVHCFTYMHMHCVTRMCMYDVVWCLLW